MSFSSEVKEELSHVDGHENHCLLRSLVYVEDCSVKREDIR